MEGWLFKYFATNTTSNLKKGQTVILRNDYTLGKVEEVDKGKYEKVGVVKFRVQENLVPGH